MDALVILLMPFVLLWMLARLLIPRGVFETAAGHLLRDFFWIGLRMIGAVIVLPLILLSFLLREMSGAPPPRRRRRRGRRRRRN